MTTLLPRVKSVILLHWYCLMAVDSTHRYVEGRLRDQNGFRLRAAGIVCKDESMNEVLLVTTGKPDVWVSG